MTDYMDQQEPTEPEEAAIPAEEKCEEPRPDFGASIAKLARLVDTTAFRVNDILIHHVGDRHTLVCRGDFTDAQIHPLATTVLAHVMELRENRPKRSHGKAWIVKDCGDTVHFYCGPMPLTQ